MFETLVASLTEHDEHPCAFGVFGDPIVESHQLQRNLNKAFVLLFLGRVLPAFWVCLGGWFWWRTDPPSIPFDAGSMLGLATCTVFLLYSAVAIPRRIHLALERIFVNNESLRVVPPFGRAIVIRWDDLVKVERQWQNGDILRLTSSSATCLVSALVFESNEKILNSASSGKYMLSRENGRTWWEKKSMAFWERVMRR